MQFPLNLHTPWDHVMKLHEHKKNVINGPL